MSLSQRLIFEVFKRLDLKSLLLSASPVCSFWYNASTSPEILAWFFPIETDLCEDRNSRSWGEYYKITYLNGQKTHSVVLRNGKIEVYACRFLTVVSSMDLAVTDEYSAVVLVSKSDAFLCGGETYASCTWRYRLNCQMSARLADMTHPRSKHSAVYYDCSIFVFGGWENTAEKYSFQLSNWTPIASMSTTRSAFNACRFTHYIYLCGGATQACEKYDCEVDGYTVLSVSLYDGLESFAFVYHEMVVVASYCFLTFIRKDEVWNEIRMANELDKEIASCGYASPVVCGKKLYMQKYTEGKVLVIDLESFKVRRESLLE